MMYVLSSKPCRLCSSPSQRHPRLRPLKYWYSFQFLPFLWAPSYKGQDRRIYMSPALLNWLITNDLDDPGTLTGASLMWEQCFLFHAFAYLRIVYLGFFLFDLFFFLLGSSPSTSCYGQLELLQDIFPADLFYGAFCFVLLIKGTAVPLIVPGSGS